MPDESENDGQSVTPDSQSDSPGQQTGDARGQVDEGPGCMPAILAATVLMGIVGFVFCGVMTWLIFQKQDALALRSMRGNFIPAVEQSLLQPEEKAETVELLTEFTEQLERGELEGWQASGVMQRMNRLPVLQWGQIRKVERFVDDHPEDFRPGDSIQFDRLRKGVAMGDVTTIDFTHILSPVLQRQPDEAEASLIDELTVKRVRDVVQRSRLVADRGDVDPDPKGDVRMDVLVRRQIEAGIKEGGF